MRFIEWNKVVITTRGDEVTPNIASRRVSGLEPIANASSLTVSQISQKATVAETAFHFDCLFTAAFEKKSAYFSFF